MKYIVAFALGLTVASCAPWWEQGAARGLARGEPIWSASVGNVGPGPVESRIESTGQPSGDIRPLAPFNTIHSDLNAHITVMRGTGPASVLIEADKAFIPYISTESAGDQLMMSVSPVNSLVCYRDCKGINITIHGDEVKEYFLSGEGDVTVYPNSTGESLRIHNMGKTLVIANTTKAQLVVAEADGSGAVVLGGSTDKARLSASGHGSISAYHLKQRVTVATVNGPAMIATWTTGQLNPHINGVGGTISYSGNPRVPAGVEGLIKIPGELMRV